MLYDFSVLRSLRKRSDLTIADVSERSGVSPAVISKLERNQCRAELDTIFRVSRVFQMSAADLIALAESRAGHRTEATHREIHGFSFDQVKYSNILCLYGNAPEGGHLSRPEVHEDDYEVCWVLKGTLAFYLPNETHRLTSGSAIQFDALMEHSYEAVTDCEIVIVHIRKDKRF